MQLGKRLRDEHEKQRHILVDLLPENVRSQVSNNSQNFDEWLASYRKLYESNVESSKRHAQEECTALKHENDQLHKNMTDVKSQLKAIEETVQSKEELLLGELKSKDVLLENIRSENHQLTGDMQRVRAEIERLQSAHDGSVHEARALQAQLDDRCLNAPTSPKIMGDESFELVKQPSPCSSPIVIDLRAEQFNELIRSSKEALDNQDSLTQQLDRHLDDMHRGGSGETSTFNVHGSSDSSSSAQQQHQS